MEHYCRWLKRKKCWQKGKRIRRSECTPCLLAYLIVKGFGTIAGHPEYYKLKKFPRD